MTPQQAALDAIEKLDNAFRNGINNAIGVTGERQEIINRLVSVCEQTLPLKRELIEALTQAQDLSMKEPGANLRSAETTSDAAPIINKAGGLPSPGKAQGVDANQITAIKKVLMAAARKDTQKETNYEIGTAISMLGEIQSGAGLEALLAKVPNKYHVKLYTPFENGDRYAAVCCENDVNKPKYGDGKTPTEALTAAGER